MTAVLEILFFILSGDGPVTYMWSSCTSVCFHVLCVSGWAIPKLLERLQAVKLLKFLVCKNMSCTFHAWDHRVIAYTHATLTWKDYHLIVLTLRVGHLSCQWRCTIQDAFAVWWYPRSWSAQALFWLPLPVPRLTPQGLKCNILLLKHGE